MGSSRSTQSPTGGVAMRRLPAAVWWAPGTLYGSTLYGTLYGGEEPSSDKADGSS